ncbi:MAG TPA: hypothetical protein VGF76_19865 [Polyangiaceae bacterium]
MTIGPDTSAPPGGSGNAPPTAPPLPAGVRQLVQRVTATQHPVQAPEVATMTLGGAMQCLGQINAMTVLLLGVKGPILGSAAGFKVGYDLGACVAKDKNTRQLNADQAAAVEECIDNGGTPNGEIGHTLICERAVSEAASESGPSS